MDELDFKILFAVSLSALIVIGMFMVVNASLMVCGLFEPDIGREWGAVLSLLVGITLIALSMLVLINFIEYSVEEVCGK